MTAEPNSILGQALTNGVQLAYLTNDTKRAIEMFQSRLGIGPWVTREATLSLLDGPEGAATECGLYASFAYMSGRMFELIEPQGRALPIFPQFDNGPLAIVPHHVGAF